MSRPYPQNRRRTERSVAREAKVAKLSAEGLDSAAIAERMGISMRQVERHLRRLRGLAA